MWSIGTVLQQSANLETKAEENSASDDEEQQHLHNGDVEASEAPKSTSFGLAASEPITL